MTRTGTGTGEDHGEPPVADQSELIGELKEVASDFRQVYKTDLKAWIDRVPVVGDNQVLCELSQQILSILRTIDANVKANDNIRQSVGNIKSSLNQLQPLFD